MVVALLAGGAVLFFLGAIGIACEDEIWAVVAFLKKVPTLAPESYRDLALGKVRVSERSGSELATAESNPEAVSACARLPWVRGAAAAERPRASATWSACGLPVLSPSRPMRKVSGGAA